jgi:hypothetical protein
MRPTLAHSNTERRRRHIGPPWRRSRDVEIAPQNAGETNGSATQLEQTSKEREKLADSTIHRARAAGGPVDVASYNCTCGMVFSASVSTSVACPHCGTEQDW